MLRFVLVCMGYVIFCGCPGDIDEPDSTIILVNNSNETIFYYLEYRLPGDTSLATIARSEFIPEEVMNNSILSNSIDEESGPWKSIFDQLPNHLMVIYLFSRDTVEQVPFQAIVDRNLVLRRYELTEADLDSLSWRVEYP